MMNRIRSLIEKGAAHVIVGSFLTKFISFFGSIFIVRLLSKEEYGVLSYYENILGYFTILAGCGMAAGVLRYLVLAEGQNKKKDCFLYSLKRGTIWNVILVTVCLCFCAFYHHPSSFQGYNSVYIALSLCIPFIFTSNLCFSSFRAEFDNKSYAYLAFLTSFLLIGARVGGAALGGLNLSVLSRLAAEVFSAAICLFILYKRFFYKLLRDDNGPLFHKSLNKYSLQIMLTDGLWAIFMLNDLFMLGQLSGDSSVVADYKVAFVIPANLSIFTAAIGVFVAPYFTKHEKDISWIKSKLSTLLIVSCLLLGTVVFLFYLLSEPLVSFIYGEEYRSAASIMSILLLASFFNNGIRSSIANVLSSLGKQTINLFVAGGGIVLQLVLNFYMIPRFGAYGVAWSSVFVYFAMSLALFIFVKKSIFYN